jgi:hypothetical protein
MMRYAREIRRPSEFRDRIAAAEEVAMFLSTGNFEDAAGEGVAVDFDGNVYAAEGPISRPTAEGGITTYLKR